MPTCKSCKNQWTWIETVRSFRMICPYCKKKQYVAASSRKWSSIITLLVLILVFAVNLFLDLSIGWGILIAIGLGIIVLAIQPFVLELSNEMEPFV
ncbi:TIGR04104 family putative zinc finger protein [Oceanobacillus bengalensis]|uniref:Cxxc_20_cxxc protein n=1 Tax=Oceanobacillus bengalensis TaxID=1435466 RepID=A0A494YWJ9_9BACI|nr:TIGR04104 family putative zinc finger protein [Oceanobacillus bengalensis]RKQ14522.1 hypothetical protein D8M05_12880 [Oceanobacillus bengalensis]